jgi:hypothetical protein
MRSCGTRQDVCKAISFRPQIPNGIGRSKLPLARRNSLLPSGKKASARQKFCGVCKNLREEPLDV